ncbi:unnamed protein product [Meloidogyne enterolobii]|uniref:Uncharacterized protein n=1 Tax=Meloidogyne enterolobii TaxID=390850 RepID=A0ACB1AKV8_MELEN
MISAVKLRRYKWNFLIFSIADSSDPETLRRSDPALSYYIYFPFPKLKILSQNYVCKNIFSGSLYLHCEVKFDTFTSEDSFDINYSNFFEDEILTDFLIKVDKNVMKAHRFILAKNSKVFYAMFQEKEKNMTEEIVIYLL